MSFKEFRFGKMPTHWESKRIIDYTEIVTDYVANGSFASLKENVTYFEDPNYAVLIRLTDYNRGFDGQFVYIDEHAYNFLSKTQLFGGEIIISNVGANVGTVFKVPYLRKKMNLGPNSIMVKTKGNDDFYFYWFSSPNGQESIKSILSGSAQPKFNKTSFRNLELPIPPYKEQNAIAHILSTLDDKIEVNNQINKTLENMAQAIFKQWFVDFEFPNEDGEPYKSSGGEMVESELGMIPKGWEVGNLAESKLTKIVKSGMTEFSGEKIYLATADVENSNILSKSTKVTHNERPSRANMRPRENTVWFAKMKDSRKLIRVSKKSKELIDNYIFSTGFAGINVKEGLNYIWSFICSEDFDTRKNNLCNGTTMQAINNSNISNIPLLLPNEEILKKYEDITDYLFESEYLRKKENEKLAEIRDTLLPKLMSGEIRVPLDSEGDVS
ncbi:MAG: hypothetical protein GX367_03540 [Bacteroidales bacterium]|mgnify:FL=1|nr:hypothetical protein [Bacteroidales bacterium]